MIAPPIAQGQQVWLACMDVAHMRCTVLKNNPWILAVNGERSCVQLHSNGSMADLAHNL